MEISSDDSGDPATEETSNLGSGLQLMDTDQDLAMAGSLIRTAAHSCLSRSLGRSPDRRHWILLEALWKADTVTHPG